MELTRFQKIMLAVLAGMLALFSVLMAVFRAHPGVLFEERLLKVTHEDGQTVYSGRAHGDPVRIAVAWPTNFEAEVEIAIGDRLHDLCRVESPLEAIQTDAGYSVNGIRITKNGEEFFRGGYNPEEKAAWFDETGAFVFPLDVDIRAYTSADPWGSFEVTPGLAARFAFGPETAAHGDPALFGLAVFLSFLLAVDILFHRELFRWRHWAARDPEPTEDYLALERVGWVIAAAVAAGFYIAALVSIY